MTARAGLRPLVLGLVVLATLPSAASGLASRTWVSGVGNDGNDCSRESPCKTFAGAISKTEATGTINVLDPGGFGGVTIDKALTIRAHGGGGVLVQGTNAFVVNAGAGDRVTFDGLDINGFGASPFISLTGIKVLSAGRVNIANSTISGFKTGVSVNPTSATTRVVLRNNEIYDNGIGVIAAPGSNAIASVVTTLRGNLVTDNACGVVAGAFGTNATTPVAATNCGTAPAGTIDKPVNLQMWHNGVIDNGFGVFGRGAATTTLLAYNEVVGNPSGGLKRLDGAVMKTSSPATNVFSNAVDDPPNGAFPLG